MSDELFEVVFLGQIVEGSDPEQVKAKVGKMFKADAGKLATLFSGNRVGIKKNINRATATKYKAALFQAGAICEVNPMSAGAPAATPAAAPTPPPPPKPKSAPPPDISIETGEWGEVAPPPQVDPLGITGDQIDALDATLAPTGSVVQSKIEEVPEPQFDLAEFEVAPVGSELGSGKKEPEPPPPDTSGITMAD